VGVVGSAGGGLGRCEGSQGVEEVDGHTCSRNMGTRLWWTHSHLVPFQCADGSYRAMRAAIRLNHHNHTITAHSSFHGPCAFFTSPVPYPASLLLSSASFALYTCL
jgi:hypothetical protein